MHGASSSPGIHPFSQPHRGRRAGRQARPRDPRQLCRPQASQSARLARSASTLDLSFHTHFLLLGQCDREFFRLTHPSPPATRCLPLARRSTSRDQPLPQRAQPQTQALRLDGRSRPHHRKAEPWVSDVGVKPLVPASTPGASFALGATETESYVQSTVCATRQTIHRSDLECTQNALSRRQIHYLLLKCTIAVPHPTPCTQRFCNPGMSGAMSVSDTIICAVNDSSLASPAR